jgi:hypothetical protein
MAEETKKNPPNLFTDPNFLRLSNAGRRAAFELLTHDLYDNRLPGLWFFAIYGDPNGHQQAERRAALHARCSFNYGPSLDLFFAELEEAGWFDLDPETSLVRVSFAPLYYPPADRFDVYRWLRAWHFLPDCEIKRRHLPSMRAACEYDAGLVALFDQWVVELPEFLND